MTLFPTKFENGKIEYKIRYKGRSRPFSRAKALVTSEQSRDPTKLKELLSQVLTITLDGGTSSTNAYKVKFRCQESQLDRQLDRARNKGNSTEEPNFKKQPFKMLRGEGSKPAFTKREVTRGARRILKTLTKEDEEEIERVREERRTKRRNDPISSESEVGEFEIGVNIPHEEDDESPSEEEGEEVNQEIEESEHESNENVPMEEEESEEEEDELPMYQEHYDALFSMDFVETKYPHDDTMRALGIFVMWSWSSRTCAWPSFSLTAWSHTRSSLVSSWHQ
ncbi:unnamed protein product [Microthlaspi erraticum]|uniref:Arabidopsis retrotransposon Orf1 C-terminal domain-containing protein n=1 Tax=Microthlaspi erraticum TaxID=1685480 RepID=A0A6D2JUP0_9BRAS|nr:unnamed protein product [Microthlaspi erraticum]